MSELDQHHALNHSLDTLADALQSGRFVRMRRLLASLHPAETAHLLESLPPAERKVCWPIINPELRGEVLSYIGEDVRTSLMVDMDTADLLSATEDLDTDDVVDLLQDLPDHVMQEVLRAMDSQRRRRIVQLARALAEAEMCRDRTGIALHDQAEGVGRFAEAASLFASLAGSAPTATQYFFHIQSLWASGQLVEAERIRFE